MVTLEVLSIVFLVISATSDKAVPTSINSILLLRPLLTFPKISAEIIFLVFLLYYGSMLELGKVTA